ncbi:helix-turn-helix transcriptional regulator [Pontibacter saemangeumensis]|uniref:Helix-turn-helix transcriptional regulator n=1 Tax=Pontibacter saemangeumensis TaxID=1084525 RepID=A0ABP8M8D7_9BACT
MVERIRQIMEHKGLTSTQLADSIEVPRAIVSHILSGRNKPSLDVILKIVSTYRDVDRNWLLLGEGSMLMSLASAVKEKEPQPPVAERASAVQEEAPMPAPSVEKVQEAPSVEKKPAAPERSIEQVMIFYSDKSFTTYRPSS